MSAKAERERRRHAARQAAEAEVMAREKRKDRLVALAAIVGFVVIVVAAVVYVATKGSNHPAVSSPRGVSAAAAVTPAASTGPGTPPQIVANVAQANQVIDTPITQKLAALHGVPVVVNQWAAWCPNCKFEFPFFQQESRRYLRQVAFVGLDSQDKRGDAQNFLAEKFPVDYPSVFDESAQQAQSLGGGQGWPTTMFFDRTGRETFVHEGAYASVAALDQDIHQYALGS